jgi:hypothetical protein
MERVLEGSTRSWVNQSLEGPLSNGTGDDGEGRSLKPGPFYICGRGREDEELWVLHFFQRRWSPFKRNDPDDITVHKTPAKPILVLPTTGSLDTYSSLLSSSISLDSSE